MLPRVDLRDVLAPLRPLRFEEVRRDVFAERRLPEPNRLAHIKVTEATLTYVAIGSDRRPRPLPVSNESA